MRTEEDSLGTMQLDDTLYYGIQTERARRTFAVSGKTIDDYPFYIRSIVDIKRAAALANKHIGALDPAIADAIVQACDDYCDGFFTGQFPLDMLQGGGGTSTNMNVNEVLANRANEILTGEKGYGRVHPNTHVNMCQSTNDVIPSAMKISCVDFIDGLLTVLRELEDVLAQKTGEFAHVVKLGRTCLQDAVPLTLGQEFGGYHAFVQRQKKQLEALRGDFLAIPLGATAVGTGMGAQPGYVEKVFTYLCDLTGLELHQEDNLFDGLQNGDMYVALSARLKALATGLSKIASDLRLLSSGPRAGLGEISLPPVQPGSSIMPGKVNPVIAELVNQVCYRICGNDITVTMAVEGGELDLNVWEPVIVSALFDSFMLLTKLIPRFAQDCLAGILANKEICLEYAGSSLALSAVIAAKFDYATGCRVAAYAQEKRLSIFEACVQMGILSREDAGRMLDPTHLV